MSASHNPRRSHWETVDGKQLWREGHGLLCTCPACRDYDGTFPDAAVAEAWKYNSERIIAMQCLPSGNVVLYDYERRPFYIGDWFGIRAAYETRPPVQRPKSTPAARVAAPKSGINLDDLNIDL